jgi:F0F1-type ATP synthase assembly protein I
MNDDFETKEEKEFEKDVKDGFYQPDKNPESIGETNRKSGMAYGAVTLLVAAILVFLGIGWLIDRYFQTAPIFLVVGIILGTIIGFYQFYKISSQID